MVAPIACTSSFKIGLEDSFWLHPLWPFLQSVTVVPWSKICDSIVLSTWFNLISWKWNFDPATLIVNVCPIVYIGIIRDNNTVKVLLVWILLWGDADTFDEKFARHEFFPCQMVKTNWQPRRRVSKPEIKLRWRAGLIQWLRLSIHFFRSPDAGPLRSAPWVIWCFLNWL